MATSKIRRRQLADQIIDDSKVASGAGIQTSKLAEGTDFVKRTGAVAFTGDQSMGGNKLTNLGTPAAGSNDAVRQVDLENAVAGLNSAYKYRTVRVRATGNVNISNPGTDTFDGVTLTADDQLLGSVLLANQTAQSENGLYLFTGSGTPMTRLTNANAWNEFPGSLVFVNEGTTYGNTRWSCTSDDGGTLGTTAIIYTQDMTNGLVASNFVDQEVPGGALNGSNTAFTLANTPVAGSDHLYLNGVLQKRGAGNDYTISGANITMAEAPGSDEDLRCSYRK